MISALIAGQANPRLSPTNFKSSGQPWSPSARLVHDALVSFSHSASARIARLETRIRNGSERKGTIHPAAKAAVFSGTRNWTSRDTQCPRSNKIPTRNPVWNCLVTAKNAPEITQYGEQLAIDCVLPPAGEARRPTSRFFIGSPATRSSFPEVFSAGVRELSAEGFQAPRLRLW